MLAMRPVRYVMRENTKALKFEFECSILVIYRIILHCAYPFNKSGDFLLQLMQQRHLTLKKKVE